jgi:predicted metal-dependent peptidase
MLKHHLRSWEDIRFREHFKRWNYACDYAINPSLKRTKGLKFKECWLYDSRFEDNLAEWIFDQIPDPPADAGGDQPGEVRPWPGPDGKKGKTPTPAEVDRAKQEVDQWVRAAAFKSQGAGKMDDNTKGIVNRATASTVQWTEELVFLMEEITRDDYSFSRPNPRYMDNRVYMPVLDGRATSDLTFFLDRSGSLSESQLQSIMTEIREIITDFDIRVIVVYWNTQYCGHEIFDACDVLDPEWKLDSGRGGGTNFRDCWSKMDELIDEEDIDPKGLVFFSDLECRVYPDSDPDLPVIWCQTPDCRGNFEHSYINYLPEYGKRVLIPVYQEVTA